MPPQPASLLPSPRDNLGFDASSRRHLSQSQPIYISVPTPGSESGRRLGTQDHGDDTGSAVNSSPGQHPRTTSLDQKVLLLPGLIDRNEVVPQFKGHQRSLLEHWDVLLASMEPSTHIATRRSSNANEGSRRISPSQRRQSPSKHPLSPASSSIRSRMHSPAVPPRISPRPRPPLQPPSLSGQPGNAQQEQTHDPQSSQQSDQTRREEQLTTQSPALPHQNPLPRWYKTDDGPWHPPHQEVPERDNQSPSQINGEGMRSNGHIFAGQYPERAVLSECDTIPAMVPSDSEYGSNGAQWGVAFHVW